MNTQVEVDVFNVLSLVQKGNESWVDGAINNLSENGIKKFADTIVYKTDKIVIEAGLGFPFIQYRFEADEFLLCMGKFGGKVDLILLDNNLSTEFLKVMMQLILKYNPNAKTLLCAFYCDPNKKFTIYV